MPIEILMPALSPTMTEGNLARWLKKEGDTIEPGMVIAEIETDKATMEVEAVDAGILAKILVAEGSSAVAVNQIIALLLEEGESADALDAPQAAKPTAVKPAPAKEAEKTPAPTHHATPASNGEDRIKASPLAKRVAAQAGVDLHTISGTGPHGRIIRADVLEQHAAPSSTALSVAPTSMAPSSIPHSMMRKVIAKRLCESKQTVPHFYLTIECELDTLMAIRASMNAATSADAPAYKLSVNDFIIKASAMALRAVPAANASWTEEAMIQYHAVDIAVAVAIDGGLITPIIRNADHKSLSTLSNEMKELAARAKANKLKPEEFQGGSFSISNLGMFGIQQFNAIINPPQSCILAIGAAEKKVVVRDDVITTATVMQVTLSCDHRVVDGAVAAQFLGAFKRFITQPVTMLV